MKFSLIIGSYNPNPKWLEEAIESAKDLFDEVIIVDDGSKTPIKQLIDYPWVKIITKENGGFYTARNRGISEATGDVICSLDDDDLFIRENVLKLKKFCQENPQSDIWHFPIELFGDQTGIIFYNPIISNLLISNQIPSGSWFRKDLWERVGRFTYPKAEDWDFWVKSYLAKATFKQFGLPVYKHRMRPDSLSAGWVGEKFIEIRNEIRERNNQ
jgi:glycosyltransferase involved in cell wall biosynthesis